MSSSLLQDQLSHLRCFISMSISLILPLGGKGSANGRYSLAAPNLHQDSTILVCFRSHPSSEVRKAACAGACVDPASACCSAAEWICVQREVSQQELGGKGHAFQAEQDVFSSVSRFLTLPFLESANTYLKSILDVLGPKAARHSQQRQKCQRHLFRDINDMMLGMDPELICSMMGIFLILPHRVITNFEVTKPSWDKMQQHCSQLQSLGIDRVLLLLGWEQDLKYQGLLKYLMVNINDANAINISAWSVMTLLS